VKRCEPFQDFGGNKFYVPMDNGRLLGTGTNGNPCSFKPASSHDYSGIGLGQVGGDRYRITNPFNTKPSEFSVYSPLYTPQFQPYVRPEFVPYTPPVNSFLEEPKYIPTTVNTPPQYTTGDNYIIQELTINLNKWQNLNYVDFSGKQLGDDSCRVLNEAFRNARLPNLLTLVLSNNQICDSGGQYLAYSLIHHYNNNLTTLILANNNLTNNGVTPFADAFNQINTTTFPNGAISSGQITKLKTLDLRGNDKVCFSGKLYFFKDVAKCKTKDTSILFDEFTIKTSNTHSLNLSNTLLSNDHYGFFSASFSSGYLSSLHTLVLSNNKMGDTGSVYLAKSLINHYCNNLTTLSLANNNLTNNGITPFADGLSSGKITKLKYLDLRENSKICFSGMLYFFKDIDKCKTKDTSILFDKFTVNTGDIYSLDLNNKLLNDSHIPWITGAFNLKWLASIHNLNLGNNQIGNGGAKLLADSLAKGEMPNLKKLHLEGNKITDEGQDALINALKNETVQDVIITAITLYEKYQLNISGNKEKQRSILENQLERAKAHGVDVDKVVVGKTAKEFFKNKKDFYLNIVGGWAKCMIAYDDIQSFAVDRFLPKLSKKASAVNDVKDGLLCYFEAENEALPTEEGVKHIKYQLIEVNETPELTGNIEAWYEIPYL